jgi:hypothetical protein
LLIFKAMINMYLVINQFTKILYLSYNISILYINVICSFLFIDFLNLSFNLFLLFFNFKFLFLTYAQLNVI